MILVAVAVGAVDHHGFAQPLCRQLRTDFADALGLERSNLYKKMRALGISGGRRDDDVAPDEHPGTEARRGGADR